MSNDKPRSRQSGGVAQKPVSEAEQSSTTTQSKTVKQKASSTQIRAQQKTAPKQRVQFVAEPKPNSAQSGKRATSKQTQEDDRNLDFKKSVVFAQSLVSGTEPVRRSPTGPGVPEGVNWPPSKQQSATSRQKQGCDMEMNTRQNTSGVAELPFPCKEATSKRVGTGDECHGATAQS